MDKWQVSMSDEKEKARLLPEGWTKFCIAGVKLISEEESKSGNAYFLWTLQSEEGSIPMITTLIKGKRWLLKQVLCACGIESKEGDPKQKYAFGSEDVEGKYVWGKVTNKEQKPFTNRKGELIDPVLRSEITAVKKYEELFETPPANRNTAQADEIPF